MSAPASTTAPRTNVLGDWNTPPPSAWHTVIEDENTVNLFVQVYKTQCAVDSNQSSKALECLVQLVSMRRTLFSSDDLRLANIRRHMQATLQVLNARLGLEDHTNYHQFCRWLARLKVNYQLDEIVSLSIYPQWIELVSDFTLNSLASDWSWVGESLYYLLSLWSKLITAMPYSKLVSRLLCSQNFRIQISICKNSAGHTVWIYVNSVGHSVRRPAHCLRKARDRT